MRNRTLCALLVLMTACTGNNGSDDDDGTQMERDAGVDRDGGPDVAVVYYRDVKPIIDARCNGCHAGATVAPIDFSVPMVVQRAAPTIRDQVLSKLMPPWHADDTCNDYKANRSLTQDQIDTIVEWIDLGAHLGDPADEGEPLDVVDTGLSRVDMRTQAPEPYTPVGTDDYRCFVIEWPGTETQYVTGFNLEPSNLGVVHHANIYVASGQGAQSFRDRDANAPGAGYPCFGGAFAVGVELFGAWAPGSLGIEYPAGTGLQIDPGSVIVMEMHFNTGPERQGPDQSTIAWQLASQVERRALIAPFWNFQEWSSGNMPIPAGQADVVHSVEVDPDGLVPLLAPWLLSNEIQIWGTGMHMHYLGTQGSIHINRPAPAEDTCVIEIPRWDFNWQLGYLLEQPIDFTIGEDTLMLECRWDNRAENQPVIDGVRRTPRDVNWGQNSDDEMCIGYLYITEK